MPAARLDKAGGTRVPQSALGPLYISFPLWNIQETQGVRFSGQNHPVVDFREYQGLPKLRPNGLSSHIYICAEKNPHREPVYLPVISMAPPFSSLVLGVRIPFSQGGGLCSGACKVGSLSGCERLGFPGHG